MPNAPPKILLADDEYPALEVLEILLRGEGFEVVTASDGQEALEILAQQPIDLIITDYKMPRMDGFELCARLRKDPRLSAIPVLMTSATYGIDKMLPREVRAFIPKPIVFPSLLAMVHAVLTSDR